MSGQAFDERSEIDAMADYNAGGEPTMAEIHGDSGDESTAPGGMNLEPFRRFVAVVNERKALKAQEKVLQEEIEQLALSLPDIMMAHGIDQFSLDGKTLHVVNKSYAKAKDGDYKAVSDAFIRNGFGSLVQISSQTLNSFWTGLDKEGEEIPGWLQAVAEKEPTMKLQARASTKKKK